MERTQFGQDDSAIKTSGASWAKEDASISSVANKKGNKTASKGRDGGASKTGF